MARRPGSVTRFFGYAMIAVGVLITLSAGGCTLVGLFIAITEKGSAGMIRVVLVFGLPVVAIGVGLFIGGRSLTRRRGASEPPDQVF